MRTRTPHTLGNPLSPRGRGLRRLSERSELSRSWVRGPRRRRAARERYLSRLTESHEWRHHYGALTSARTCRCATPHPASPKLGCASPRLRILLPQGEKGILVIVRQEFS